MSAPISDEKPARIYYIAVVHQMTLGRMAETGELAVVLVYAREEALVISLIISEMQRKGVFPKLYFEMRDPGDVSVLFRLPRPSAELINRVVPKNNRANSAVPQDAELIATGESEFEYEALIKYLLPAAREGKTATLIIENPDGDPVVMVPIKEIVNGMPSP